MITDDKRLPTSTEGRDPIIHAVASLAAAISLLERTEHAKNAAASDKMFSQMLQDYRTALDNARTALASAPADPEAAEVDFLVRVLENLDTWRSEEWSELLERRPAILAMLRPMVLASAPVADERQAFETRFNVPPDNWTRSGGGGYRDIWHETRWEGWRARAALASAPVADERAAFETAYTGMLNDRSTPPTFAAFMRNPDGSYALPIVERAWAMWQARAALASAPVAGEASELLRALVDLHAVARVDRDEDYAAVSNAAEVIAKHAAPQASTVADERAAFETAYKRRQGTPINLELLRDGDGYTDGADGARNLNVAWETWQDARAALASSPVADERAAFEAWAKRKKMPLARIGQQYDDFWVDHAWNGWQARAALASAPVADTLPHWEEVSAKLERDETLTPLEFFIYENEPAGADAWRDQLAAALASAPVAGEAQKPVGTLLNQHGEILWHRKPDYFPADFYAAPQASEADPLQGAADWLMRAFEPPLSASDLARQLVIGYNRATRLRDAALSAQQASEEGK